MIKYSFKCKECEEVWDEWLKMKDCEKPEKRSCPKCKAKRGSVSRYYGKAPAMKMDSNYKIDEPHRGGGWQDAVQRMVNEKSAREKKMKEIKETTKATDDARMVNHKANLDAEGAD